VFLNSVPPPSKMSKKKKLKALKKQRAKERLEKK
jgi:hypothetical protein